MFSIISKTKDHLNYMFGFYLSHLIWNQRKINQPVILVEKRRKCCYFFCGSLFSVLSLAKYSKIGETLEMNFHSQKQCFLFDYAVRYQWIICIAISATVDAFLPLVRISFHYLSRISMHEIEIKIVKFSFYFSLWHLKSRSSLPVVFMFLWNKWNYLLWK